MKNTPPPAPGSNGVTPTFVMTDISAGTVPMWRIVAGVLAPVLVTVVAVCLFDKVMPTPATAP